MNGLAFQIALLEEALASLDVRYHSLSDVVVSDLMKTLANTTAVVRCIADEQRRRVEHPSGSPRGVIVPATTSPSAESASRLCVPSTGASGSSSSSPQGLTRRGSLVNPFTDPTGAAETLQSVSEQLGIPLHRIRELNPHVAAVDAREPLRPNTLLKLPCEAMRAPRQVPRQSSPPRRTLPLAPPPQSGAAMAAATDSSPIAAPARATTADSTAKARPTQNTKSAGQTFTHLALGRTTPANKSSASPASSHSPSQSAPRSASTSRQPSVPLSDRTPPQHNRPFGDADLMDGSDPAAGPHASTAQGETVPWTPASARSPPPANAPAPLPPALPPHGSHGPASSWPLAASAEDVSPVADVNEAEPVEHMDETEGPSPDTVQTAPISEGVGQGRKRGCIHTRDGSVAGHASAPGPHHGGPSAESSLSPDTHRSESHRDASETNAQRGEEKMLSARLQGNTEEKEDVVAAAEEEELFYPEDDTGATTTASAAPHTVLSTGNRCGSGRGRSPSMESLHTPPSPSPPAGRRTTAAPAPSSSSAIPRPSSASHKTPDSGTTRDTPTTSAGAADPQSPSASTVPATLAYFYQHAPPPTLEEPPFVSSTVPPLSSHTARSTTAPERASQATPTSLSSTKPLRTTRLSSASSLPKGAVKALQSLSAGGLAAGPLATSSASPSPKASSSSPQRTSSPLQLRNLQRTSSPTAQAFLTPPSASNAVEEPNLIPPPPHRNTSEVVSLRRASRSSSAPHADSDAQPMPVPSVPKVAINPTLTSSAHTTRPEEQTPDSASRTDLTDRPGTQPPSPPIAEWSPASPEAQRGSFRPSTPTAMSRVPGTASASAHGFTLPAPEELEQTPSSSATRQDLYGERLPNDTRMSGSDVDLYGSPAPPNAALRPRSHSREEASSDVVLGIGEDAAAFDTITSISVTYGVPIEDILLYNDFLCAYELDEPLPADLPITLPVVGGEEEEEEEADDVAV